MSPCRDVPQPLKVPSCISARRCWGRAARRRVRRGRQAGRRLAARERTRRWRRSARDGIWSTPRSRPRHETRPAPRSVPGRGAVRCRRGRAGDSSAASGFRHTALDTAPPTVRAVAGPPPERARWTASGRRLEAIGGGWSAGSRPQTEHDAELRATRLLLILLPEPLGLRCFDVVGVRMLWDYTELGAAVL
jgi:hypothetical protein